MCETPPRRLHLLTSRLVRPQCHSKRLRHRSCRSTSRATHTCFPSQRKAIPVEKKSDSPSDVKPKSLGEVPSHLLSPSHSSIADSCPSVRRTMKSPMITTASKRPFAWEIQTLSASFPHSVDEVARFPPTSQHGDRSPHISLEDTAFKIPENLTKNHVSSDLWNSG